jgi:hypothetical protein
MGMPLQHLNFGGTGVSNLSALQDLPLLHVDFSDTPVADEGLKHLHGMKSLTSIVLTKTKVTAAGVDELHKALPGCRIHWDGGVLEPTAAQDQGKQARQ